MSDRTPQPHQDTRRPPLVDVRVVERYLHSKIPVTVGMGVTVASIDEAGVRLTAPLAPNINHRGTVFGGSSSTLAILAAWAELFVQLRRLPFHSSIVIQRNSVEYLRPMRADIEAYCATPEPDDWARFVRALERRGRGRIALRAELRSRGAVGGVYHGVYVAYRGEPAEPPAGAPQ